MSRQGIPITGWHLKADHHSLPGKSYSIGAINEFAKKAFPLSVTTVFGRDPSCSDIALPGSHVSRRHAELILADDHLLVRDLGSANGTFINGVKITEGLARPGDEIRFDTISLKVVNPNMDRDKTVIHPRSRPFIENTVMRTVKKVKQGRVAEIAIERQPMSLLDRYLPKNMDVKAGIIIGLIIITVSAVIIAIAK
ncbi:MAG: FHA domain-containing protein [Pseudomonadales bacterium]|nr:FHA domain-containing protein [Pseudomonadales bacterium]